MTPTPRDRQREAFEAAKEASRAGLLRAAKTLFLARGYVGTTVASIAAEAGYSVQTLYTAWGSKRALLRAATTAASIDSDKPMGFAEWRAAVRETVRASAGDAADAPHYLDAVSDLFVAVAERTAPYWRLHHDAASTDPEIAEDWNEILEDHRTTMTTVAADIPAHGLRPGLTPGDLADTLWALAGPEMYNLFTVRGGKTAAQYRDWLAGTLTRALTD